MRRIISLSLLFLSLSACVPKNIENPMSKTIRQASVAGQFYLADKRELDSMLDKFFSAVSVPAQRYSVKALIVPHAAYVYSGATAAYAYKQLIGRKTNTVYILCNSHTNLFPGLAIDPSDYWQTPLGQVGLDHESADKLVNKNDFIEYNRHVHASDHAIEVQLPFLQKVLGEGFKIVPIAFGNSEFDQIAAAEAIAAALKDDDLLLVSSDLSHYPEYEKAKSIDGRTISWIASGDISALEEHDKTAVTEPRVDTICCGLDAVKILMRIAEKSGWKMGSNYKYSNSGDSSYGVKDRVVGYGSLVFSQASAKLADEEAFLSEEQKSILLTIAKETIQEYVCSGKVSEYDIEDKRLMQREGAFVTLYKHGALRGCIGRIIPGDEPLWQVVRDMSIAAATEDPRFPALKEKDLVEIKYEISVLSAPKKIDDWKEVKLGTHGVIVKNGMNSGVFLPQVATETGWSRREFLESLCSDKAGLPKDCYLDSHSELSVFTAQVFSD